MSKNSVGVRTPHLRFDGKENVLAVRLTPENESSRWYPGAGLYRNVWLDVTAPVHVARWGTFVTTPQVTDAKATLSVKTEVRNEGSVPAKITPKTATASSSISGLSAICAIRFGAIAITPA